MPEPSAFEFELAIEKLRSHKSPGIDQIPAELIKAGGRTLHRRGIKQTVITIGAFGFCQLCTKFYPTSFCQG